MAWIESHTVLSRHRKLKELARELRLRPVYLMGHLHALWHDALEQAEDGDLSSWSDELIAESAQYPGDAPQFVSLLQKHKWLDGRLIHDWLDYAGLYLTKKYSTSNRNRLVEIWAKHGRAYGKTLVREQRTESEQKENLPDPTGPNQTKPDLPNPPLPDKDAPAPEKKPTAQEPKRLLAHEYYAGITEAQKAILCQEYPHGFLVDRLSSYIATATAKHIHRISASRLFEFLEKDFAAREAGNSKAWKSKDESRREKLRKELEEIDYDA